MKNATSKLPLAHSTLRTALRGAAALPLIGLGACTGGGTTSGVPLDEGSYTVDEFDYTDPFAPDFHPLSSDRALINSLSEQLVLVPYDRSLSGAGTGGEETLAWVDESALEGFAQVPGPSNLFGYDLAIRGVAAGTSTTTPPASGRRRRSTRTATRSWLHVADRAEDGSVHTEVVRTFDPGSFQARDSSIELADVDGDGRDELIVVARQSYFGNPTTDARCACTTTPRPARASSCT